MKALLISSIAILGVIGGGLFIMDNNLTEEPQPGIGIIEQPVIKEVELITEITEPTTAPIVDIMETTVIDEFDVDKYAVQYFVIERNNAYLCAQVQRLKWIYPERFTKENALESFEYLEDYIDGVSIWDKTSKMNNFHW
jgi:hypothetical protein